MTGARQRFHQVGECQRFVRRNFLSASGDELLEIREEFPRGKYPLRIEESEFSMTEHRTFVDSIKKDAAAFRRQQQQAFHEERERWAAAGHSVAHQQFDVAVAPEEEAQLPDGIGPVTAPVTASVWNIAVTPGQHVEAGQSLIVLEAMKMEILVAAPSAGVIDSLVCTPGALVQAGQRLITMRCGS